MSGGTPLPDWNAVLTQAVNAARTILADKWPSVAQSATIQITALVQNGAYIAANRSTMDDDEYSSIKLNQQRALEGVLSGYEAISITVAEQAAAAAWGIVEDAISRAA